MRNGGREFHDIYHIEESQRGGGGELTLQPLMNKNAEDECTPKADPIMPLLLTTSRPKHGQVISILY